MKDIIPAKKESPILGLTGLGGGVGSNIVAGGAEEVKYIEQLFNTYLFVGNETARSIPNGINNTKGGLVWIKNRSGSFSHTLFDSERGVHNIIRTNNANPQTSSSQTLTSFDTNGFSLGTETMVNRSGDNIASWNFREQEGFFDIVKWTGDGTGGDKTISHDLGCVPGCIIFKNVTAGTYNWQVYHRGLGDRGDEPQNFYVMVNSQNAQAGYSGAFNVTSTQFTLGGAFSPNANGEDYIAYVFAGGRNTAATSSSVKLGGGDRIYTNNASNDFNMGTGDFTIEFWVKTQTNNNMGMFQISSTNEGLTTSNTPTTLAVAHNGGNWHCYGGGGGSLNSSPVPSNPGTWQHVAYVKHNNVLTLYVEGTKVASKSDTVNYNGQYICIGGYYTTSYLLTGYLSNFRIVKGTAVYTSSFRPPTEPLTAISGTTLLCCNDSTSVTGSTVTPVTLRNSGGNASFPNVPFNDPNEYKFGENEDQNLVKCGCYKGLGSTFPEIHCGWQPQWILIKNVNLATENWFIFDSMRGIVTKSTNNNGVDTVSQANQIGSDTGWDLIDLTPTGFKIKINDDKVNNTNGSYIYIAVRMSDGYVGKPAVTGTDVFAMDAGQSSTLPCFDSGFTVDYVLTRDVTSSAEMYSTARLTQKSFLVTATGAAESTSNAFDFAYNLGCCGSGLNSTFRAWMWKRGKGFDVVTWKGNGTLGNTIPHSMGVAPEMIWVKNRDASNNWYAGHMGLNNGVDPWHKYLDLNLSGAGGDYTVWNDTPPTATHFQVGHESGYNGNNEEMMAILFASIPGISKCGYYTGTGSNPTITTGFSPRFLLIKRTNTSGDWMTFDTLRGFSEGNGAADCYLKLNELDAQNCNDDWGYPTSDGFVISTNQQTGGNTSNYIYYAHA